MFDTANRQENDMSHAAMITKLADVTSFVTAGNAVFTLVSKKSGCRKTFKVERADPLPGDTRPAPWFVRLLNGPDNGSDYRYLGIMFKTSGGFGFKLNKQGWASEAGAAFAWFLRQLTGSEAHFNEQAECWHEGRCGRCGRALTDPESIARGIGPVCAEAGAQ